ncbi:MAG TPA: sigma-70 family RNA polymerase sigma factor [Kofleriaceae bacterium]|nr:sigma-70 family RNA polymerase sigma factor [Kofleriaceae bacterium]
MAHPAPTANDLLAHTDWLHQLARALVGDAAAGDVVQQTYEIALTHPPKREGALRPWLGGVARNVARMTTRGRVRRQRREDAVVATPTADVPTPEELVARVQLHQRVASIVLALHEPLRSTLLLRFFEGMSAAEIARAQGIPAATVRSRLQDALARVRETLDEEHRGDRRAWAVVLVPSIAAVPSGSAALAGGMLVKTGLKIVVALVVAAVLVVGARFAGLWGGDGGATATPPAPLAKPAIPSAPPATTPPARAAAAGPRELPAFHDADPQGTLRLEGQVIDEHDAPVAGALVAIDSNPPRVVETEGDGSFAFDGLIPRDYHVESSRGDGYAGPAWLRLGPDAEPVTLRMRRGGTVEVVVTDKRDGSAVEGAEVELRSALTWKATTDAAGIATLRGVGPTWSPLAVRAAGFAPAAMMLGASGAPAAPDRVSISLARGAALSGRVDDERGKPVGGARVVATSASEPMPVVDPRRDGVLAAADGTFTLASVAAGTWRITATHADFAPQTSVPLTVDGEHEKTGIVLALTAGGVVRGVVKDKAGSPVASAEVSIVASGYVFCRAARSSWSPSTRRARRRSCPSTSPRRAPRSSRSSSTSAARSRASSSTPPARRSEMPRSSPNPTGAEAPPIAPRGVCAAASPPSPIKPAPSASPASPTAPTASAPHAPARPSPRSRSRPRSSRVRAPDRSRSSCAPRASSTASSRSPMARSPRSPTSRSATPPPLPSHTTAHSR